MMFRKHTVPVPPYKPQAIPKMHISEPSRPSLRHVALLLLTLSLTLGCRDKGADERIVVPPKEPTKPYDESLLRWRTYPETQEQDGPWTLAERAEFYGVPGVAIYAWNNRTTVDRAHGIANPDNTEMLTTTVVPAGPRLSTGVSSLVVMAQLTESSRDLNKALTQDLSGSRLRSKLRGVTLGQLLSHSAGIGPARLPDDASSMDDLLSKATYLAAPGFNTSFSQTGYAVVQHVLENATVRPWGTIAEQRLFKPLGLTHTQYDAPPSGVKPAAIFNFKGRATTTPTSHASAANGLFTSAKDLATLLQAVQQTLSRERRDTPFNPRQLLFAVEPELGNWTMGWEAWTGASQGIDAGTRRRGRVIVAMGPGNRNIAVLFRDRRAGAVITTNGARGGDLAREVLLGLAQQFGWTEFEPTPVYPSPPEKSAVEGLVGKWSYVSETIEIAWQNGALILTGFSENPTPMLAVGANTWILRDAPQRITLEDGPDQIRIDGSLALRSEKPIDAPIVDDH